MFCACHAKSAFDRSLLVVARLLSLLYEDDDAFIGSWNSLHADKKNADAARRTVFLVNHIALPIMNRPVYSAVISLSQATMACPHAKSWECEGGMFRLPVNFQ